MQEACAYRALKTFPSLTTEGIEAKRYATARIGGATNAATR